MHLYLANLNLRSSLKKPWNISNLMFQRSFSVLLTQFCINLMDWNFFDLQALTVLILQAKIVSFYWPVRDVWYNLCIAGLLQFDILCLMTPIHLLFWRYVILNSSVLMWEFMVSWWCIFIFMWFDCHLLFSSLLQLPNLERLL